MPSRSVVAIAFVTGAAAWGCRSSPVWEQHRYDTCRSYPEHMADGTTRSGFVSNFHRELKPTPDKEPGFHVSIKRSDCLDTVTIKGPGVALTAGPFLPIQDETFVVSHATNRLAFAVHKSEKEGFVWIDGKTEGPYRLIAGWPTFSKNGRHLGYVAEGESGEQFVVVDGRVVRRFGQAKRRYTFQILDDGRAVTELLAPNGDVILTIGDTTTGPLVQVCSFDEGPNGHWGYTAKTRQGWVVVIDGRESRSEGRYACRIAFSDDGAHFAYLVSPVDHGPGPQGVVVDDHFEPLEVRSGQLRFIKDLATVTFLLRGEQIVFVAARPTPPSPPTADDYQPSQSAPAQRVRIGQSMGPLFDRIELESLRADEQGRLHYRGWRLGHPVDVVDHQIVGGAKPH
jgi:hypothetical protein